jgi:sugar phosphate isomerase/epimerase
VWGSDPVLKLDRSVQAAERLGAQTVVVHPPFRWQRRYADGFADQVASLEGRSDVMVAVENMFPWRAAGRELAAYAPSWDIRDDDYPHTTLDFSHTAVSRTDPLLMAHDLGSRLSHIHLADGTGSARDEHLVPGRGTQPVAEVLDYLVEEAFDGAIIVEVSTRGCSSREERVGDLAEALAFARQPFDVLH